ncbi:MAG: hypothetical protein LBD43_00555 [Holosporales bacterium]|jgi:hypothetical protein|nr:hypothetical protein [Holosporales bacterium]
MYKNCRIVIRFLISRPGDIFILKLIWNKTHDVGRYFLIYQNLMKRMMATIKHVTPRDEETLKQKLNGKQWTILSNGNMTKLAVVASEFGFTPDEIEEAIPKTDGLVERQMLDARMIYLSNIAENTDTKEIDVPVVVYDKKCYPDLSSAAAATQ